MPDTETLTWQTLLDECSRVHTTRTRPLLPGMDEQREDAQMMDVFIDDMPAVVVPTRMHEPGFYVRSPNGENTYWNLRSEEQLEQFRKDVEAGKVRRRGHKLPDVDMTGFMKEWSKHENAPRTPCPECHFESSEGWPPVHAPGCSVGGGP